MTKKEIYSEWTKLSGNADLPIFMQSWWLDAVCAGKEWDVMLYPADADSADKVVAAMPYLIRKRLGVKFVIMPQMTQIGGMTELMSEGVTELMSEGVLLPAISSWQRLSGRDGTVGIQGTQTHHLSH